MRRDYAGHDGAYRCRRAEGSVGWDGSDDAYAARFEELRGILDEGSAPRGGRLIEVGCGAGNVSVWLAQRGFDVVGVDISSTAIAWARERAAQQGVPAQFVTGDATMPGGLPTGPFDLAIDGHCYHCIIGDDRARFLDAIRAALVPGGYFLVATMCGPVSAGAIEGYDPVSGYAMHGDMATRYFGLPEAIEAEIDAAGFYRVRSHRLREGGIGRMFIECIRPR